MLQWLRGISLEHRILGRATNSASAKFFARHGRLGDVSDIEDSDLHCGGRRLEEARLLVIITTPENANERKKLIYDSSKRG